MSSFASSVVGFFRTPLSVHSGGPLVKRTRAVIMVATGDGATRAHFVMFCGLASGMFYALAGAAVGRYCGRP